MANVLNLPLTQRLAAAPEADGVATVDGFILRHDAELRRYLHSRVRNPDDVNDLVQECYARLLRYCGGHPHATLEPSLLFRIANNLLTDAWRRHQLHRTEQDVPYDTMEIADAAPAPDQVADERQTLARLKQVVRQLPPKCQEVFVYSRWLGMSNGEVAAKLGISVKAVEKHITKALAACRAEVGDAAVARYSE